MASSAPISLHSRTAMVMIRMFIQRTLNTHSLLAYIAIDRYVVETICRQESFWE